MLPDWSADMTPDAAVALYLGGGRHDHLNRHCVFTGLCDGSIQRDGLLASPGAMVSRDPLVFHAIGVFTATFLYAIAALAWVGRQSSAKVPFFSGWLVVGLLLASVGVFIGLVQSLSRLQINNVLAFTS
jgi:hypothetical protein